MKTPEQDAKTHDQEMREFRKNLKAALLLLMEICTLIATTLIRVFFIYTYYTWFMVPVGLPEITPAHAFAFWLFIGLIALPPKGLFVRFKKSNRESSWKALRKTWRKYLFRGALIYAAGYILKYFI